MNLSNLKNKRMQRINEVINLSGNLVDGFDQAKDNEGKVTAQSVIALIATNAIGGLALFEKRNELAEEFKALGFDGYSDLIFNIVERLDGLTEQQKDYVFSVLDYISTGRNLVLTFDQTWK